MKKQLLTLTLFASVLAFGQAVSASEITQSVNKSNDVIAFNTVMAQSVVMYSMSWNAVSGAATYKVTITKLSNKEEVVKSYDTKGETSFDITQAGYWLKSNTDFKLLIDAYDKNGRKIATAERQVKTEKDNSTPTETIIEWRGFKFVKVN